MYRSTNRGDSWEEFNQGLTSTVVEALAISPTFAAIGTLFAGTSGGGVVRWDPPPIDSCILGMDLGYESGALAMEFVVGTPEPATFKVWMIAPDIGVKSLVSKPIPVIDPPITPSVSFPFPNLGAVGFLTTLSTSEGIICWDFDIVDTGPASSIAPSAQELRELFPRLSGAIPSN